MKTKKKFDCVEMKHRAQKRLREELAGRSRQEEIAFFRKGAEDVERRIASAKAGRDDTDSVASGAG